MALEQDEKLLLLKMARESINFSLQTGGEYVVSDKSLPDNLKVKASTFVTLTKKGELRGCIGKLIAIRKLYADVIENALSAAINDYRFSAVTLDELRDIKIEISVLSKPIKLKYADHNELLSILSKEKPGIVLKKGHLSATFLPQVWESIRTAERFLEELCVKAGMEYNDWKSEDTQILTYTVENFEES